MARRIGRLNALAVSRAKQRRHVRRWRRALSPGRLRGPEARSWVYRYARTARPATWVWAPSTL